MHHRATHQPLRTFYLIAALGALLTACAPIPVATTHWLDFQPKVRSVRHWKLLADHAATSLEKPVDAIVQAETQPRTIGKVQADLANLTRRWLEARRETGEQKKIVERLRAQLSELTAAPDQLRPGQLELMSEELDYLEQKQAQLWNSPPLQLGQIRPTIYIRKGPEQSDFDRAFETYLADALTRHSLGRTDSPEAMLYDVKVGNEDTGGRSAYIAYGVELVRHRDSDTSRPTPGEFTLLGTGVWLGHQAAKHWSTSSRYLSAIPTGALLDLLAGTVTGPTHTEVIVSIALVDSSGSTVDRIDKSFYVDDADASEYPNEPLTLELGSPIQFTSKRVGIMP